MKTLFFLWCLLFAHTAIYAQNRIIRDNFEDTRNRFRFEENFNRHSSAMIQSGGLVLQNRDKNSSIKIVTEIPLPMDIDRIFKVISTIFVPNLQHNFGVIFNYVNDNSFDRFVVAPGIYTVISRVDGIDTSISTGRIILRQGRNREVVVEMERRGSRLIFNVDNMEAVSFNLGAQDNNVTLRNGRFGFISEGANTITIKEVAIDQILRE